VSPVTPENLDRLSLGPRLRLGGEVLVSYVRVRWAMRGGDAERAVRRLRERARGAARAGTGREPEDVDLMSAWRLAHATRRVLELLPSDSRCLFRSLTLMCMLERRGIAQTLVVAVRPRPFGAHAWLEVAGEAVLPDADAGYERLLEL